MLLHREGRLCKRMGGIMRKFLFDRNNIGSGMWIIPLTGVLCVLVAWFIAYTLAQGVGDREREAFEQARQAQVESCERANLLREEINTHVRVLDAFLIEAAVAREAAGTETDIRAAQAYRDLAEELEPVDIPDCDEVVPRYERLGNG